MDTMFEHKGQVTEMIDNMLPKATLKNRNDKQHVQTNKLEELINNTFDNKQILKDMVDNI